MKSRDIAPGKSKNEGFGRTIMYFAQCERTKLYDIHVQILRVTVVQIRTFREIPFILPQKTDFSDSSRIGISFAIKRAMSYHGSHRQRYKTDR